MADLLTEPVSGNYVFSNPLPDPQYMALSVPGGLKITADGRLALAQLTANTKANTLDVRYAAKEGQVGDDMATALVLTGYAALPAVTVNDKAVKPVEMTLDGAPAAIVPLTTPKLTDAFPARYAASLATQETALQTTVAAQAWLRYKAKQEHYVLTEPRNGAFSFWRQWPGNCAIEAGIPGGMVVATDGDIALQRIILSARERRVEVDYAPYLQQDRDGNPIPSRAKALLVFGLDQAPSVRLHNDEYKGAVESVTINGKQAYLIPLFGDDPAALKAGIEQRYADAMATLPPKK
jgi:hypothetical protein